jgi:hypothetical protein
MFGPVDTRIPQEVEEQVKSIYRVMYRDGDPTFIALAFDWAAQCFNGRYADYQAIDARYHDFEHTLQGTLCLARLLHGWCEVVGEGGPPVPSADTSLMPTAPVSRRLFELALLAILFHDTGYLKKRADAGGTGAKYTYTHVERSAEFARVFLSGKGYAAADIEVVRNMISCTGVNANLAAIPFRNDLERQLGYALATADLLGQMAAHDYVDKLPILFQEFSEAASHNPGGTAPLRTYSSVDELLRNTRSFWSHYVLPKINDDFGALYRFLNRPYPDGPNPYMLRIEQNLRRLDEKIRRQLVP